MKLARADVRAYLDRPWSAQAVQKSEYWRARKNRGGLTEVLRVADVLRRQAQLLDPSWPHKNDREEDLETHTRVATALRAVAPAGGPRAARVRRVR